MRTLANVYIIEDVADAHAQKSPLERFLAIPGLRAVFMQLSEIWCLLIR